MRVKYYLPEEQFTYGIPNRPSTPIKQVIGGEFGNNSALFIEEIYRSRLEEVIFTIRSFDENFHKLSEAKNERTQV